jgi:hypothetical protein
VDRAASSRHNHFSQSLLLFRVRHSQTNQRYARLAQFAALERMSPLEQLVRVHTLRSRHFGDASTRSQRKLHYRQLLGSSSPPTNAMNRTHQTIAHVPIFTPDTLRR